MFSAEQKPLIMGILNVTPDSFSDGGRFETVDTALRHTEKMLAEGADIIDVGGESTRPYSLSVSAGEQIHRILPVIRAIRSQLGDKPIISVDTRLSSVAKLALAEGANMINDVSAGRDDPQLLEIAAKAGCPLVLMHRQGNSATMQDQPYYENLLNEVISYLNHSVELALAAGVLKENLLLDPGIGFGKRQLDDMQLLAQLPAFVALGFPILLGSSRKRVLAELCGINNPLQLATATAATTALGVMAGVKVFRVHDVLENRQAADVAWAIKQQLTCPT